MTAQTLQNRNLIAVYSTRQEAERAKQAIQSSGIGAQKIMIDDHVDPYLQVAAEGTTVGGEAGLLMGAFLGGILGVIVVVTLSVWTTGTFTNTNLYRLMVVGSAIVGAILGALSGKAMRSSQPPAQKIKGNRYQPREYRLLVNGSQEDVRRAQSALEQPVG